eukprot:3590505-Amphidinium_carterae.1
MEKQGRSNFLVALCPNTPTNWHPGRQIGGGEELLHLPCNLSRKDPRSGPLRRDLGGIVRFGKYYDFGFRTQCFMCK